MDGLLIPVAMLETKLGKTLGEANPSAVPPTVASKAWLQAEQTIWMVSVRARSVAEKSVADWADPADVPDLVKAHVLEASYRVFKNPNRYLANAAIGMSAQLSHSELNGDIFLREERIDLEGFRDNPGMWTLSTTRGEHDGSDLSAYVDVSNGGARFPLYGPGEG